ncbi:MAG: hypothetical protein ACXWR0_09825 [Bdellovibrio sp.]
MTLFNSAKSLDTKAQYLRVSVVKENITTVNVALPAESARWLLDLIPANVIKIIHEEGIPIDEIQSDLAKREQLHPQSIFSLNDGNRTVSVWLE